MKNNIVVLILLFLVFIGAGYYAYSKWKSLQPPPRDPNQMYSPYMPGGVPAPPPPPPGNR